MLPAFIVLESNDTRKFSKKSEVLDRFHHNTIISENLIKEYEAAETDAQGYIYDKKFVFISDNSSPMYRKTRALLQHGTQLYKKNQYFEAISSVVDWASNLYVIHYLQNHPILVELYQLIAQSYLKLPYSFENITLSKRYLCKIINVNYLPTKLQIQYDLILSEWNYRRYGNEV